MHKCTKGVSPCKEQSNFVPFRPSINQVYNPDIMMAPELPYTIVLSLFVLTISIITALFEIEVEGPHGWATYLPTWRLDTALFKRLLNGKSLTGYHLFFYGLLFLMFHFPLLFSGWSSALEFSILSCYFQFTMLWDLLWFILNPYFGWKRYMKGNIWWFRSWFWLFPVDYYISLALSACFAALSGLSWHSTRWFPSLPGPEQQLIFWAIDVAILAAFVAIIILFFQPKSLTHPLEREHDDQSSSLINE